LSKGSAPAAGTPACPWPADQVERWPSDVAVHRWQVFTGRAAGIKLPVNRLSEATIAKGHPSLDLRRQFPQTRAAAVRV
jgi:hypothetical protein